MRGSRWLALLAATALLAGCGGGTSSTTAERPTLPRELREVRVSLNREVGPEHAGLLMAEANGYFADVGLKVVADPPSSPTWSIRYLLSKLIDSDFSLSHEPQVAISVENGKPIVAVGSLISEPIAALIWLKGSGIERISDLKEKTIAVPGLPFQVSFLESLLARSGLKPDDVKVRHVGFAAVPLLVSGRVDAIFGGSSQLEGTELRSLGLKPLITPVQSEGVPPYGELVLIATTQLASKEPQLIRDFMAALSRGTAAAVRNPQAVVREIESHVEPSPVSSRRAREAQVAAILPLLSETGYMDPGQAKRLIDWMHSEGMIRKKIPVSTLLTNEHLPQSGQ
jgi:putative hydroxymethylpyrimidine transport system substrate-binding protein